jgi:hypothetical protein
MIFMVADQSAAPERHSVSALTLISRGLLSNRPCATPLYPHHALTRAHSTRHHLLLSVNISFMGVSSYWFSLDSHGDGEGYRPLTVEVTLHRFFLLSNTCIHGSFSVVEHSDLESRLYISFVAFSLASLVFFFRIRIGEKWGRFMVRTQWHAWFMLTTWIYAYMSIWT